MHIVVTGATGFIGQRLLPALAGAGHTVIALARSKSAYRPHERVEWRTIPGLESPVAWPNLLEGAGAIVHLAGVAHIVDGSDSELVARYHAVNCEATLALARAAVAAGVRRFVFMSSIRVHGNAQPGTVFRESDTCVPSDEYGRSKLAAEQGLLDIVRAAPLEVVRLRPPLVYGPGVGANFLRLLRWVDRGVPLPFGSIRNRRSFIFVDNLIAAIAAALEHPHAVGQSFLVSDGEDLATPGLLRRLAAAMGRSPRLLGVPPPLLRVGLGLIGRSSDYQRLCGDAALDDAKIRTTLGFAAPHTLDAGLAHTVRWYRSLSTA